MRCTKILPEFESQSQRSKVKVTGDKKTKKCGILFGSRPLGRGPRAAFFSGAVLGARGPPPVLYAGGKISACCLVLVIYLFDRVLSSSRFVFRMFSTLFR